MSVVLRPATEADAVAAADVYLASHKAFVGFARLAHTDDEVREWVAQTLVAAGRVTVAVDGGAIVGLMAISTKEGEGWIDLLYLAPGYTGRGVGALLVTQAKATLNAPIYLWAFQENHGARRFYERQGFAPILFTDGHENEEKCPDVLYEWRGGG